MPSYETNQTITGFIRRVKATFNGFTPQNILISGQTVPMIHAKLGYRLAVIHLAILTRPGESSDTMILSIPLFRVPTENPTKLFEQLLSWNNGATGAVHFALDELINSINIVCVRPLEGLDFQEFQTCLDQMLNVRLNAFNELHKNFAALPLEAL
jgi:Tir chaperone protein (CesT) family